ncbi:raftlin-2 [Fukomys damarensis]|uniref:Raftlin-2 n=1 Tax=Fukomys damarensis TaxID=885580 RepID=A0A091DCY1_FUKDA|nr:raftlin-2 [Fukomys damarensis]KFO30004.1 Raftlin-2 [Fukomys damarensis]
MGCGLRKLGDPEDSSPGKIFSTLKRPQVETKTDLAYEYVLLNFTLRAPSSPEMIRINSVVDIAAEVEDYYLQGYVLGALHPILHPAGSRGPLPASHLYRAVLLRPKASPKCLAAPSSQRRPRLVIEECPVPGDAQASDIARELTQKINAAARRGMRFVGFTPQLHTSPPCCNGARRDSGAEPEDSWPGSGLASEGGTGEQSRQEGDGSPGPSTRKGEESRLYAVFNAFEDAEACWSYQEGVMSLKVTRKGAVLSTLDADWLELTTFYYKQGLSLIDSFVCWDSPKGDHLPKSLEGFFIYEEEGSGLPGSPRKGKDAIVVEQWTIIEGTAIKADYGPLLHTLAEFGWLLTNVLPTPVLRRDREGNLATKQVVFLQRSALPGVAARTPERSGSRLARIEDQSEASSRSPGPERPQEARPPAQGGLPSLSPSPEGWAKEGSPARGNSALRQLDDGQCDPEDGLTQVTCM